MPNTRPRYSARARSSSSIRAFINGLRGMGPALMARRASQNPYQGRRTIGTQTRGGNSMSSLRTRGTTTNALANYSNLYKKKRVSRKAVRRGRAKRNKFLYQLSSIQNPYQSTSFNTFSISTPAQGNAFVGQTYWSLDFLKGLDVRDLFNQSVNGTATNLQRDTQLYIRSFVLNVDITNTDPTNATKLDMYMLVPRQDISEADIPSGANTNGNDLANWIRARYGAGINDQSGTQGTDVIQNPRGDTSYYSTTIGVTPFMMPQLTRNFKIISARRLVLNPGQHYTTTVTLKAKYSQYADWDTMHYKRGFSKVMLVRQIGVPGTNSGYCDPSVAKVSWNENQTTKVLNIRASAQAVNQGAA